MSEPKPSLLLDPSLSGAGIRAALVWGFGMPGCSPTAAAPDYIEALLARVREKGESFLDPARKAAVRDMLRFGKYKPAGRSKPSSEYLLAAALEGDFPLVNGPVDANNTISLEWGYPASIFDMARTGSELLLRRGVAGERYVFNLSGQEIELEDLLLVCARARGSAGTEGRAGEPSSVESSRPEPGSPESGFWEPCGNPVKDAMATKLFAEARDAVAIVYAPASDPKERLEACAARFAELLRSRCGAASAGFALIS